MKKIVSIELRVEDAEPFLRNNAELAARYSAYCDYLTPKVWENPAGHNGKQFQEQRKVWLQKFLTAKRIVEAFGVEYEPTSEEETLTVGYPLVVDKAKNYHLGSGLHTQVVEKSHTDYDHPKPKYRGDVHKEACRQAADRVVRRWRAALEQEGNE